MCRQVRHAATVQQANSPSSKSLRRRPHVSTLLQQVPAPSSNSKGRKFRKPTILQVRSIQQRTQPIHRQPTKSKRNSQSARLGLQVRYSRKHNKGMQRPQRHRVKGARPVSILGIKRPILHRRNHRRTRGHQHRHLLHRHQRPSRHTQALIRHLRHTAKARTERKATTPTARILPHQRQFSRSHRKFRQLKSQDPTQERHLRKATTAQLQYRRQVTTQQQSQFRHRTQGQRTMRSNRIRRSQKTSPKTKVDPTTTVKQHVPPRNTRPQLT